MKPLRMIKLSVDVSEKYYDIDFNQWYFAFLPKTIPAYQVAHDHIPAGDHPQQNQCNTVSILTKINAFFALTFLLMMIY